ncbi:MAG: peptidoglycan DD-metalloendopeptidase family protein [Spirochaetia bacterium]|nr:peptidoglycan DD-metalloendopeptidase family protein [Spirochaetia bacterium]
MKYIEKLLFILAFFSITSASMILFSEEIISESEKKSAENHNINEEKGIDINLSSNYASMIVYSKEIDEAIDKYFEIIKGNPQYEEEQQRIIEFDTENITSDKEETIETPPKKEEKESFIKKHQVKEGESLWRIAQKYDIPVYTIVSANPGVSNKAIQPGDIIEVPESKGIFYKVKNGDSLSKISHNYKLNEKEIITANSLLNSKILIGQKIFLPDAKPLPRKHYVDSLMFRWPLAVRGRLTSGYGWRKHPVSKKRHFHTGLDIAAAQGSNIVAASSGVVIFSGNGGSYGNMVILRHKNGYFSVYAHASKLLVNKGQYVKLGKVIAKVGKSGYTTGAHLHFEVKKYKKNINPHNAFNIKIKKPVYM